MDPRLLLAVDLARRLVREDQEGLVGRFEMRLRQRVGLDREEMRVDIDREMPLAAAGLGRGGAQRRGPGGGRQAGVKHRGDFPYWGLYALSGG
jgi:hypothetical protein